MLEKNSKANGNPPIQSKTENNREKRIMNAIVNTSIILMSTLMGGFAEFMATTVGTMASGMAEATGDKEASENIQKEIKQKLPEVTDKMKAMMSDVRKDIYSQMAQKREEIEPFLSDPIYDAGLSKIDKYDFGIPKLTEELDDEALTQYSYLLISEDATFAELFKELTEWMNTLPTPPKEPANQ